MEYILIYKKKVINTANGFIVRKYLSRVCTSTPPELTHELRVNGGRLTIRGSITKTVAEIKQEVGFPCQVYYVKKGQKRHLNLTDRPFLKMYVLDHNKLNLLRNREIIIRVNNYKSINEECDVNNQVCDINNENSKAINEECDVNNQDYFRFNKQNKFISVYADNNFLIFNFYVQRIRKLVVSDIYLKEIDIRQFHSLRYLRLENTGLLKILMPEHRLFYCNLSRNRLETVVINADVLILKQNRLRVFVSNIRYKYLNCSNNPLKRLKCNAEVINVQYCRLKHLSNRNARRIIADHNKGLELGGCRNVVNLSITYCGVKTLPELKQLRYLKARGNCLQRLCGMDQLEYVDVEDNFLMQLSCQGAKYLNVAKNSHVEGDWEKHKFLKNIKIEFTNIDMSLINKIINRNRKTKVADDKDDNTHSPETSTNHIGHNCRRSRSFANKYTIPLEIGGYPARLIVVMEIRQSQDNHTELLLRLAETACTQHTVSVHLFDWLVCEADKYFGRHRAIYVLVTPKVVLINSRNLPVLCVNFGETIRVSRYTETLGFSNVSLWRVIPLFCPLTKGVERRLYKVQNEYVELGQLFEFLGYFCPLSLKFTIENSLKYLQEGVCDNVTTNLTNNKEDILTNELTNEVIHSATYFKQLLKHMSIFDEEILTYGYGILDFGNNFYLKKDYSSFITVTDPVFIFIKLIYASTIDPIVAFDEYNIMNLMDVYVKAFSARYIEKGYRFCILGFNSPLAAVLWALQMRKTFSIVGLSVSIGIVKGTVFRSEHDGRLVYGGPAFNKVSRIVDLGTGIFMSDDFIISHPLIYTVDEGKMLLKGFIEPTQIYSLYLKSSVKQF